MAQLDKFTFVDQSFLIFFSYLLLYIFHSRFLLPLLCSSLKTKTKVLKIFLKNIFFFNDLYNNIIYLNNKSFLILFNYLNFKTSILLNYLSSYRTLKAYNKI
jgi:hypothetical protein